MKSIAFVFGTRPEAIKLAPVIAAARRQQGLRSIICSTGQHRQMLDQVLSSFRLKPDIDMGIMQRNQTLAGITSRAVRRIDTTLKDVHPDLLIVQGDTTTAFCAALAAFYNGIPIAHVEAGLRTWNLRSPWPEEANRLMVSRLANLHFAPTVASKANLLREGIPAKSIHVTGNTAIDALRLILLRRPRDVPPEVKDIMKDKSRDLVLITGHRRENFGEASENICRAILTLAMRFPDAWFLYPVHLNPEVRRPVFRLLRGRNNIRLCDPLPYETFSSLLRRSKLVLTDSGGIQEEAPFLGKPVIVLRDVTERPEAVAAGAAMLAGTQPDRIVRYATRLLKDNATYRRMARTRFLFGDGHASERIVAACRRFLLRSP